MKKILFLLLSTVSIYGQVSTGQEQEFDYGIKNNSAQTVTTANHLTTTGADGTQGKILPSSLPISTAVANALDLKVENSAGAIQGFAITDNGNGTVNIATGTAYLRTANDPYSPLIKYVIPAVTNLALTDNANNFVLVDYNGGIPALTVSLSAGTVNTMTNSIAYVISRVGNTLDYVNLVGQNVDANGKLRRRFLNSEGLKRASGAVLSGLNRNLILTGGLYYSGLTELTTPAFNTSTGGTFTQAYLNGGNWVRTTGNTQINNTQYSLAGVLTTMPSNDYRVDYVFILADNPSKLYVLLGNTTYNNIASARLAPVPSDLVSELQYLGGRVGRIIIQKDATTMEVSSEFATIYQAGSAQLHNDLAGLNAGNFQHLTVAEKANLEVITNKQNSLAVDGTGVKYPTVDAINQRYGLVQNIRLNSDFPTNLFLGDGAGINNTPISDTQGRQNGFFGVNAGRDNTTGYANLFLGYNSGYQNTTGTRNTYLGYQSGFRGLTNNFNTFIGTDAGYRNTADNNIFMGFHSGFNASNLDNITGDKNIIIGNETAGFLNTGYSNNIIGHNAGFGITTGHSNILHGYNSGLSLTTGSQNVLIGVETGQAITTGTNNVYLGFRAGFFANNSTYYNTGIGDQSLFNLTSGSLNTAVGGRTGLSLTTGVYNTFIGFDAGNNALQKTDALFSTAIGYGAYNTADDQVVLGGASVSETVLRGVIKPGSAILSPNLTGIPLAPTAAAGTNTTQIATTAFVNANARPYKVYTALLSQTGTNAPVATVLENTLGGAIVWSRDGDVAGHYTGTLTGVFLTDPFYLTNNFGAANAPINVEIQRINNNSILLWTRIGTSTSDGLLNGKTSIEIRVYN